MTRRTPDEEFLRAIGEDPLGPRELARELGLPYRSVLMRLYELEAKGLVQPGTSIGGTGTSSGQLWHLTDRRAA